MRIEDFPRPKDDNGRGVHWSASVYHPTGAALDFWIGELQAMHIKWVKLMDDGGGSSMELCSRLIAADIMPIVRLYRLEPNPGSIGGREEDTIRQLIAIGVRYFETNNEPDLPAEWKNGHMPPNWLDVVIENFIHDADKIIGMGGLPAVPAMGVGSKDTPVEAVVAKGRADLFDKGAWLAIHNYTLNHPLDYPFDSVNQEGAPVSEEEYDRLGSWAWEGRSREQINAWRENDKNPGATLEQDPACFLSFYLADQLVRQALGHSVPIISTEGGPVVGWKDDRRYPRLDPNTHAEWVVALNDFMQGGRDIHGLRCSDNYFAMCHWLIGNYRLGFMAPGWESQSWYSDWWNQDFNLRGALPVVAAVKAMPNLVRDSGSRAVIAGQLLRADTLEPLPDLVVDALSGSTVAATDTSAADGSFRLARLVPGIYDLSVRPWGTVRRGATATVEPVTPISIRLVGGCNSVLVGKVQDRAGNPQTGVQVTLRRDGTDTGVATTATDGGFRFDGLPLGSYRLSLSGITVAGIALDGWNTRSLKLTTGGASTSYRYASTMRRLLGEAETAGRHILFGTVLGADGAGLDGIKVEMSWLGAELGTVFPTTNTGRDPYKPKGYYEFICSAGSFSLRVAQGDWPGETVADLDTANVPGREGQPIAYEVDFALQAMAAPARIDGVISGGPTARKLKLVGPTAERETALAADGTFAFENVSSGAYRLELAGVGAVAEDIVVEAGGLFKLFFPMRSKLTGQVLSPTDGLVAVLYAPLAWGWTRQAPLDPDGNFTFEALPPGRYRVEIGELALPDLTLTGENVLQLPAIDLAQGRRSIVRGRVADQAGKPKTDVLMVLRRAGLIIAQLHTSGDGTFRFANLLAGVYALEATGMGIVASGIALDGQRDVVQDVLWVERGPSGLLLGRILAADGTLQANLTVRLLSGATEIARTQSDTHGAFRFGALGAGVYALAVGDGAPLVTDIRLDEDATVTRDITLPAPHKPLANYLLFGGTAEPEARLALGLALEYLHRTGTSGGFSVSDATQAAQVTIVGDGVAAADELALRAAGCQVRRLEGNGYAIAAAFKQLMTQLGEG